MTQSDEHSARKVAARMLLEAGGLRPRAVFVALPPAVAVGYTDEAGHEYTVGGRSIEECCACLIDDARSSAPSPTLPASTPSPGGGSYAAAKAHQAVRLDILAADLAELTASPTWPAPLTPIEARHAGHCPTCALPTREKGETRSRWWACGCPVEAEGVDAMGLVEGARPWAREIIESRIPHRGSV